MMMEAGLVIGSDGEPIRVHLPSGRSSTYLPDSRELWEFLWEHKESVAGIAHSHPGSGIPGPSHEDITTFAAIEAGLGRRLSWWIASSDMSVLVRWKGPERLDYVTYEYVDAEPSWMKELRWISTT
jgi:proteasome lid subunit RPN8/RPN11